MLYMVYPAGIWDAPWRSRVPGRRQYLCGGDPTRQSDQIQEGLRENISLKESMSNLCVLCCFVNHPPNKSGIGVGEAKSKLGWNV